jgi:GrpB-like predicted nucleotidyltransferase (UPF0157 family)
VVELTSGIVILLFALTIPMSQPVLMLGYVVAAGSAFFAAFSFPARRSAQITAAVLALIILAPAAVRFVRFGVGPLPGTAARVAFSLLLVLFACQGFVLVIAARALGARGSRSESLGLESGVVRLLEYDERWPALFAAESGRILAAVPTPPLALEHVGSTSVPGLCAKPVLDILAGHPTSVPALAFVAPLERAGYEHRGDAGIIGHQFFRRGQPRAYHIHLVEQGGRLWREYLAFRDYLRSDSRAAAQYAELKRGLAARHPRDRESYISGKSQFVVEAIRRALGPA